MTPINFVTFLVSLWLVDYHYHHQREYESAARQGHHDSRLPAWLHRLIYKPQQPYSWAGPANGGGGGGSNGSSGNNSSNNGGETRWYYHSKQKKLMRLHAAEAFEMRKPVLVALGLVTAVVLVAGLWATACAVTWLGRYVPMTTGGIAGLSLRA